MKTLTEIGLSSTNIKALFVIWSFIFLLVGTISIVFYFINAFSLYKISSKFNYYNRWYSFVPFFNCVLLDAVASTCNVINGKNKKKSLKNLLIAKIIFVFTSIVTYGKIGISAIKILFIADKFMYNGKTVNYSDVKSIILSTAMYIAVTSIVYIMYLIIKLVDLYSIYKVFVPKIAVFYIILSFILPIFIPIILFAIQNKIAISKENTVSKDDTGYIF